MKILVAPSGFKESMMADKVADCIEQGIRRISPAAEVLKMPIVDGGEGFTKILVDMTRGSLHQVVTKGPVGEPVHSFFGFLGGEPVKTAVIEMAATAGLALVPHDRRNPMLTTTYGLGELIKHALDAGAQKILIGCGDSGTNDGGAGMVQALGAKLLDKNGKEIEPGAQGLLKLHAIDVQGLDPRLKTIQIDAACNPHVQLCGKKGVARVFGPQKGATPQQVELMDQALNNWGKKIQQYLGIKVIDVAGTGASGGLGAGLLAFLQAPLHPRYDIIMKYQHLDDMLEGVDLVVTAEGAIDFQTPQGKVPVEVARQAKLRGIPVVALAGTIGKGARETYAFGIDSYISILKKPCSLESAIEDSPSLIASAAERVMRFILVGINMSTRIQMNAA